VPTSADDVFFDAASTGTCTISTGNTGAKSINCTGFTGTIAGSANITIAGSVTLVAGMTYTHTGTATITGTSTLITAGKTFTNFTVAGSGITVALGDAVTVRSGGSITVTQGTFNTNGYNVNAATLASSNSNTRAINLGSSTVTLTGSIDFATSTGLTFTSGTSQINTSGNGIVFNGGGQTFYNVAFTSTNAGGAAITGANTFNNLSVTASASAGVTPITFDSRQTINGTLSTTGTAGNRRVWFRGATYGLAQTLTINATPSLTDADFRDIYVIGTAAPISGTRIGDLRGIRGITFSTPKTVYWNLAGAQNWSANGWSDTSTGTPNTNFFPLAQDTATFTNAGSVTGTITMNSAVPYTGTVDMSGRTSAMTLAIGAAFTIYGDWKNGSGTTLSTANTLMFSGRNTQTITSAGKTFSGGITVDSYSGTVELADALNIGSQTLTVTNGTFDTKNFNVTASGLSSSGSNVRTITLGSSTVTLSSSAAVIALQTSTNLTFNAGTSQINLTSTSTPNISVGTAAGSGVTFYNMSFTGAGATSYEIRGQPCVFTALSFPAPTSAGLAVCVFGANQTITGTLTVAGATAVRRIFVRSDTLGTTRTLTVGTLSATDCDFRDITIAGAAAGSSPTRAGDCGGNSGITFPASKTVYWNLAGTQNWSATAWAPSSGGTPDINQFPLAQDTAVFDEAGSVTGAITINAAWNIGTFDASARTSAMTISNGSTPFVYGDWGFGTGVTSSNTSNTITFAKRGTQTITSSGIAFKCPIDVNSVNGLLQLADAFEIQGERNFTLTSGTFDAVTYNVTLGLRLLLTGSTTRTLKMGSGTWTLTVVDTFVVWDATTTTNLNFYKGTANILLSGAGVGSTRTFHGGGLSYNKLTIGGTTGTSTTTITGNNQFTELASTKTVAHTIDFGSTTQTFGKWTVTGTSGNVVTLTGTGTSHILAGACTSGIDYLAMGSIGFANASPGEFYAGANSTGTAGAPVYRTAKPADSTRYWVGGTGNWNNTNNWSTSSGGGSGASVPRSHDDVVFDSLSNATAYTATVGAVIGGIRMKSLTIAGPASGNVTLAGTTAMVGIHGNVTLPATGLTRTYTGAMTLSSNSTGLTFTTNGVSLNSDITVNGVDCAWALGSALDMGSSSALTVNNGSIDLATYNLTGSQIVSNNGNSRTIDFGTGTTQLSGAAPINFGTAETNRANLTVTAGTSQINISIANPTFSGNNQTFYNVSFTGTSEGTVTINGANSFNDLSFTGLVSVGLRNISLTANQTVTGTLTFSAGTNATRRNFVQSNTLGTTRTLTVAAFSGTDVDFRDITVTGAAAPVSGTRLGDCKGNSGITFVAGANKYWNLAAGGNWGGAIGWATSSGGTPAINNFPLAQDTCIFEATGLNSGATITINNAYNIGTIDMSARTTNTMTLATGSTTPAIYGNWINGTGTTLTGTGTLTFAGRGSQTITSAGKTFTQSFIIDSPGGSVTLQDAFVCDRNAAGALTVTTGTFDANGYNVTLSGASSSVATSGTGTRTVAVGSGTLAISGTGGWTAATSTNLTVTGTGTISLTSASAKVFEGGGVAYTNITLNQGGAGTLSLSGNNTFKDITNTYKATGATNITFFTTTQRVSQFTAAGESGRVLTVQGTSASSPGTLVYTGSGTAANVDYLTITGIRAYNLTDTWYAGTNSTNNGSLGWYFQSGGTTITASVSETSTASDVISALGSFGSAVSETVNIADSILGGLLFQSDLSETVTGSDSVDAVLIFNRSVNESAIAVDSINTLATFNSNIAELTTGTDTVSSLGVLGADVSELSVASDQVAAGILFLSDIQESSNAADSVSVTLTLPADISETSTALDVVAAQAVFPSSVSETVTGTDSTFSTVDFLADVSDTASANDSITTIVNVNSDVADTASVLDTALGFVAFNSSASDSVSIIDASVANADFAVAFVDTAAGSDTLTAQADFAPSISELATAADSNAGIVTFLTSISETSTASETATAAAFFVSNIIESANSTDTTASLVTFGSLINEFVQTLDTFLVAASIFNAPFSDSATASDSDVGFITFPATISESATGSDSGVGFITFPTVINETSTALDALSAQAVFRSSISESSLALDAIAVAPSIFNVVVPESAVAQDAVSSLAIFPTSLSETATILDLTEGAFLWNMVDDSQGAAWQNVNNSQGSAWTSVNNSQGSAWTPVNNSQGSVWTDVNNSSGSPWTPVLP
jgi:hypothetical protein